MRYKSLYDAVILLLNANVINVLRMCLQCNFVINSLIF
jgi:hypothetical protein